MSTEVFKQFFKSFQTLKIFFTLVFSNYYIYYHFFFYIFQLQFLLNLSSGSHVTSPGAEMIPVKAFRIEPEEGSSGHLTVDGEQVDYGPLQAEMFPSLATVMTP